MSSTADSHHSPVSPRTPASRRTPVSPRMPASLRRRSSTGASPRLDVGSGFHLHWGRTLVALLGVLALLTAVITGILAPLTALPASVPLIALGIFVLSLVALRAMAVLRRRSRRRQRVESAIEEAMNPLQTTQWQTPRHAGLFDALSADDRGAGGPNSLQQVDEDGLPVGLERTFDADVHASGPLPGEMAEPVEPWQPQPLPRPKYLDLDKAQRVEPETLELQTPVPRSDVKLTQRRFVETPQTEEQPEEKQGLAARKSPADQDRPEDQDRPADQDRAPERVKARKHDSMDLDEVLRRRRA